MEEQEVNALLQRLRKGQTEAFSDIVRGFQQAIFNLAYRMLGNVDEASDISQDIFVKAYRSIGQFEARAKFSTWLYAIAVNMCLNQRRKLARHGRELQILDAPRDDGDGAEFQPADPGPDPREQASRGDVRTAVAGCLREIPAEFAAAVIMKDVQDRSYEEIAAALECSLGTVKSRLSRGRALVRDMLKARKAL